MGTNWLTSQQKIQEGHPHFVNDGWNKVRIVASGPRIQTWVNGQPVEDIVNEAVYKTHPRGFIGLQIHGLSQREVDANPGRRDQHQPAAPDQVAQYSGSGHCRSPIERDRACSVLHFLTPAGLLTRSSIHFRIRSATCRWFLSCMIMWLLPRVPISVGLIIWACPPAVLRRPSIA